MANKTVDEYIDCINCPNRIFNTGSYIIGGRGSIHGDIVFLFPKSDKEYNNNQLFIDVGNLYDEYSGRNNTEDVYMTYSVKCSCSNNYDTYNAAVNNCRKILWKELAKLNYKYLFIFGEAWRSISNNPLPRFMVLAVNMYLLIILLLLNIKMKIFIILLNNVLLMMLFGLLKIEIIMVLEYK